MLSWTPPHVSTTLENRWWTEPESNHQLRFQVAVVDFTRSFDDDANSINSCDWTSEVMQAGATGAFFTLPPEVCM